MLWRRPRRKNPEIAPDEIFLDASNSSFDRARFEGRIERRLSHSTFVILGAVLAAFFIGLSVRAATLQVVQGNAFAEQSENNSLEETALFAPRGVILDRNGVVLAENFAQEDGSVRRYYPYPELGPIIGYVSYPKKDSSGRYYDTEETGLAGLEAQYNDLLSGENGKLLVERDALGRVRSQGAVVPAKEGEPLRLSLDAELQRTLFDAIESIAERRNFLAGSGVILETNTGAVRALVSYPAYDPNVLSRGGPASIIAAYNSDPGRPYLDHAVQGVYAPGSVVKPLTAAGALTDGLITERTIINDPGVIYVPNPYRPGERYAFRGWKALGDLDVRGAIAWSSDIFYYTLGGGFGPIKGFGIERLNEWYGYFGLGTATGIDVPEEAEGLLPSPEWKERVLDEPWYLADTYFTAIGQYSMQVTPLQMARAIAAIANGGKLYTPSLAALNATPSPAALVPATEHSLRVAREGMRLGVTDALAVALNFPYVQVAAKTGTAQVGSRNQYDNSWVVGFFPYDNPQYAFAVVLERGPEGAGSQAVNVMRDFFEALHAADSPYVGGSASLAL